MFVISLISRIRPVLRPAHHTFACNPSSGWVELYLTTPDKMCSRRFWAGVVRALLRKTGYAGGSLTPTVCLLIALTVAAVVITGGLSATSVGDELERAVRLSWWFV
jgi:hypothetical protein